MGPKSGDRGRRSESPEFEANPEENGPIKAPIQYPGRCPEYPSESFVDFEVVRIPNSQVVSVILRPRNSGPEIGPTRTGETQFGRLRTSAGIAEFPAQRRLKNADLGPLLYPGGRRRIFREFRDFENSSATEIGP